MLGGLFINEKVEVKTNIGVVYNYLIDLKVNELHAKFWAPNELRINSKAQFGRTESLHAPSYIFFNQYSLGGSFKKTPPSASIVLYTKLKAIDRDTTEVRLRQGPTLKNIVTYFFALIFMPILFGLIGVAFGYGYIGMIIGLIVWLWFAITNTKLTIEHEQELLANTKMYLEKLNEAEVPNI